MQQLDDIPDWAKIKAYRETYPRDKSRDSFILKDWTYSSSAMKALARRIARDDKPPVSQETLIGREAMARYYDKSFPHVAKDYREGSLDCYVTEDSVLRAGIKLALEGFGKDGVQDNG